MFISKEDILMSDEPVQTTPSTPVVVKKKKHYWWKYLLFFLGGFLFALGAVGGAGYYVVGGMKTKQLASMLGVKSDQYLTEEYENKTVLEIVIGVSNGSITFNNIQDIRDITPYIDTVVDQLNNLINDKLGFTFDKAALYSKSFNDIGDYVYNAALNGISLPKVMNISSSSDKILQFLGFEKDNAGVIDYDKPRSLKSLIDGAETILNSAKISDVINVEPGSILEKIADKEIMSLADAVKTMQISDLITIDENSPKALQFIGNYTVENVKNAFDDATLNDLIDVGTEGILYNLRAQKINNLANAVKELPLNQIITIKESDYPALKYLGNYKTSEFTTALENATLGQLIDIDPTNTIIYKLKDKKVNELEDGIKALTLKEVVTIDTSSPVILQTLQNTTINDLSTKINSLKLSDAITIDNSSPYILRQLGDTNINNLGTKLNSMTIGEMIEDTSSSRVLTYLSTSTLDGVAAKVNDMTLGDAVEITTTSPQVLQSLQGTKVNDLSTKIQTLSMSDLLGITSTSPMILQAIKNSTLSSIDNDVSNLTVDQVVAIDSSSPLILQTLKTKGTKISEIGNALNTLTLKEMVTIDTSSPKILQALQNCTLNNLSTKIDELTIGDCLDTTGNRFLSNIPSTTKISEIGDAINALKFVDVFKDEIYEVDGVTIKTTWKYLLREDDETTVSKGLNYTIGSDMGKMITNMQNNIKKATIRELNTDGFLTLDPSVNLDKEVVYNGSTKKIGDFTMSEFVAYASSLM